MTVVLSIPASAEREKPLIWGVVVISFVLALPIAYFIAASLRARYQRREEARRRMAEAGHSGGKFADQAQDQSNRIKRPTITLRWRGAQHWLPSFSEERRTDHG